MADGVLLSFDTTPIAKWTIEGL